MTDASPIASTESQVSNLDAKQTTLSDIATSTGAAPLANSQASATNGGAGSSGDPRDINRYGIVVAVIVVVATLLGLLLWQSIGAGGGAEKFPVSWFMIVAAVLGSVVNEPFRPVESRKPTYGWIAGYIFWKSAISIVFAFLLYLMAISELIGGNMFPQFVQSPLTTGTSWTMQAFSLVSKIG